MVWEVLSQAGTSSLVAAAQRCRDGHGGDGAWPPSDLARLRDLVVVPDEPFCREVADRFERLPALAWNATLARRYDQLKRDSRRAYQAILDTGIAVEPWLHPGQPYHDAAEIAQSVRRTGTLRVFLTRDGHGPDHRDAFHPLREPSGVTAAGVQLSHNDLLRASHDVFGHLMFGHAFGRSGELKAAYCHMALFSDVARPVLFTEHVAQVCWFFFGAHLRDATGSVRKPGDSGYVPPHRRPYPEQKVFIVGARYLDAFRRMFHLEGAG